jgi:hypothetical protein
VKPADTVVAGKVRIQGSPSSLSKKRHTGQGRNALTVPPEADESIEEEILSICIAATYPSLPGEPTWILNTGL